jgi:hypothetical protein
MRGVRGFSLGRSPSLVFAVLIAVVLAVVVAVWGEHLIPSQVKPSNRFNNIPPRVVAIAPQGPPTSGALTLETPGPSPSVALAYRAPTETRRFALRLQQVLTNSHAGQQTIINTRIAAEVHMAPMANDANKIFISFEYLDLIVESDGKPIEIPAVNRLLAGLKVSVVLDLSKGLGEEMIIAANPQAKRLLSMLIDAVRQTHLVLPPEKIGEGARWTLTQEWKPKPPEMLTATLDIQSQLSALTPSQAVISRTLSLKMSGEVPEHGTEKAVQVTSQGQGQIVTGFDPQGGLVKGGRGAFGQVHVMKGDIEQRLDLRFDLSLCSNSDEIPLDETASLPALRGTHPLFAPSPCAQATKQ